MTTQIQIVKTDSFSMDYFMLGCGKEVLVILPGLSVLSVMDFADAVTDAYQVISEKYTVYVFDRRKELPEDYSVYEMAQDTVEVFNVLGLNHVNLFGASQGGMIAMVIAIEHPELVQKLILGSTAACVEEARYQTIEKWIQIAKTGNATELYLAFGEAVYPQGVFDQSRSLLIEAAKSVTDEDLKRFIILAEGIKDFNVIQDLKKTVCPVLVIGSRDDHVLGVEASIQIKEHINSSVELYLYDGYGHASYDTAPDYKERILNFLRSEPR